MQNIGDRLVEARKRLGLDLRQASEATKIRTDYLAAMEDGSFDFSLPEVYKKGFLKIYSRYLKLDAEKMAADFMAQFSTTARREDRDNLGRVDAPGGGSAGSSSPYEALPNERAARMEQQAAYFRLAVIVGSVVIVVVLLAMLLTHLMQGGSSSTEKTADTNTANSSAVVNTTVPANPTTGNPGPAATTASNVMHFTLKASKAIPSVAVWHWSESTNAADRQLQNPAPMTAGQTLKFDSNGRVEIVVDQQVQNLTISVNGGPFEPIGDGSGHLATGSKAFLWPAQ